jgi:CheY-like chemotaxis protein
MQSVEAISRNADKGVTLANHLLELANPVVPGQSTHRLDQHVLSAVETLRTVLVPGWQVECSIADQIPAIGLTGVQVEQLVLHLGLLVADAVPSPRTLQVVVKPASPPSQGTQAQSFAATLWIGLSTEPPPLLSPPVSSRIPDPGIIQSVISSMLDGSGGSLEKVLDRDGCPSYRAQLPSGFDDSMSSPSDDVPVELRQQFTSWNVLVAVPKKETAMLRRVFSDLGASIDAVDSMPSALARVEENPHIDAIVIDTFLLGQEARGILRALGKLRPSAGIVVTGENAASATGTVEHVIVAEKLATATQAATVLLESRTAALHRRTPFTSGAPQRAEG